MTKNEEYRENARLSTCDTRSWNEVDSFFKSSAPYLAPLDAEISAVLVFFKIILILVLISFTGKNYNSQIVLSKFAVSTHHERLNFRQIENTVPDEQ